MLMECLEFDAVAIFERAWSDQRDVVKVDHVVVIGFEEALDFLLE